MSFSYLTVDPSADEAALRRVAALVRRPLEAVARDAREGRPVLTVHDADSDAEVALLERAERVLGAYGIMARTDEGMSFSRGPGR